MAIEHNRVDVHRLHVSELPISTRRDLAKHLDGNLGSNWEILAEKLGCHPLDIDWIRNRAPNAPSHSPTLLFFNDFCTQRRILLFHLVLAFDLMDNQACITVLKEFYGSVAIDAIIEAKARTFSDTTKLELHKENQGLWHQVENIGGSFVTHKIKNLVVPPTVGPKNPHNGNCPGNGTYCVSPENYRGNAPTKESTKICDEATAAVDVKIFPIDVTSKANTCGQSASSSLPGSSSKPCRGSSVSPASVASSLICCSPDNKHLTHPFTNEDCKIFEKMQIVKPQKLDRSTTLVDVQLGNHTVDKRGVRVFVTYTTDSKAHMCNVLSLCECLKRNQFSVSLDQREQHLLNGNHEMEKWHDQRYELADCILILVSPLYRQITESNADHEAARNAVHIHQRMLYEYKNNQRSRFIAVVMPGSTSTDVPLWLRETDAVYQWPSEYVNLFYRMMKPETVVSNFVHKRDQELAKTSGAASKGLPKKK